MNKDAGATSSKVKPDTDVIVVGSGFAGIYALREARRRGFSVRGFEKAPDVGGTWYWNSYPGARCDVASYYYAYFFDSDVVRQWNWSNVCAGQAEIQRYLRFAAEHCGVIDLISFNTTVRAATYAEDTGLWTVKTSTNETVSCRYLILAIGALSEPKTPDIEGVENFAGEQYLTSHWPKDKAVDLRGKRVGVIGTGSSGIQVIPEAAKAAREVYVFQRTANYVVPTLAGPINPEIVSSLREDPGAVRGKLRQTYGGNQPLNIGKHRFHELDEAGRQAALEAAWEGHYVALAFWDAHLPEANAAISDFMRRKIQELVRDPETARRLVPWDHPIGGKRICQSDIYFQTFNEPNVKLVCLRETPIERVTADGIKTSAETIPLDVIIYATGFDAMSGPVLAIDITGMNGLTMKQSWADGPMNYLGTMVNGFPNLFLPSSAMSPSVFSNMATLAEQQIDFIFDTVNWLEAQGRGGIHPRAESQNRWRKETLESAKRRPGALTTKSWYSGANVPGKPQVFMVYCGGFKRYHDTCSAEVEGGFPSYEVLP